VCDVLLRCCCCLLQERVFELGERVSVLSQVGQPALVPHMAEAAGQKLPYEVGGGQAVHVCWMSRLCMLIEN
jgi:hypothetical protein